MVKELKIDNELKSLIPALTEEELKLLEQNILDNGIQDSIKIWKNIIIDGHNRYSIALKHDLKFDIKEFKFENKEDVIDWMINNQLGRRNLTEYHKSYLRGLQYKRDKNKHGGTGANQFKKIEQMRQNVASATRDKLSKQHDVSTKTIERDEKFAESINTIVENTQPDIKSKILNEEIKITKIEINEIAKQEPEKQKEIIRKVVEENKPAKTVIREIARKEKEAKEISKPKELNGLYDVIYIDPPWKYDFAESSNREIENQYPTMDLEDIKNIKIPCENNSVMLMWATAPKLLEAIELINTWNFEYKTQMIWDKQIIGMGYWCRGQHEILLIATKGKFSPPIPENRVPSIYSEKRTKHSKKPNYYYDLIEKMFPSSRYLEMFARQKYNEKWEVWGNQCP